MNKFSEWIKTKNILVEGILTNIDSISHQIRAGALQPQMVKRHLQDMIATLNHGQEDDPHYLHMAATIAQDILPVISANPMYRQEVAMLQALTSS